MVRSGSMGWGWVAVFSVGAALLGGCDSSDPGGTELVLNLTALNATAATELTSVDSYPAWDPTGERLAFVSTRSGFREVWIYETSDGPGSATQVTDREGDAILRPSWSPDGDSLAIVADFRTKGEGAAPEYDLWIVAHVSFGFRKLRRYTSHGEVESSPTYSPDGTRILFARSDTLWSTTPGGSDASVFATGEVNGHKIDPVWSPDGEWVAYSVFNGQSFDIYVQSSDGGDPAPLIATSANEESPAWSPSGKAIAYQCDANGNWDVWVTSVGGRGAMNLTPDNPTKDAYPSWHPDGASIAFCSNRNGNEDIWILEDVSFLNEGWEP